MNPPPIGEALSVAWNTFKANPGPILVGMLCAMLLSCIPVVGGFLAVPGLLMVSLKALRGEVPEPADGFVAFKAAVDHLVMGLLQIVGLLACLIGVYVTQALFLPGTYFILEQNLDWKAAKDRCLADVRPALVPWIVFVFVVGLVAGVGVLACFVGLVVTLPVAMIALAYAYEHAFKARTAR